MKQAFALAAGVLASLAGTSAVASTAVAAEHPAVVDDAQIELAKFGITMFSLDTLTTPATECPAVKLDELGFWMGQLGMAATAQGYEVEAFSPDDVEALAIFCGVNPADFVATPDPAAPYAIALEAFNLLEGGTFAQVIARSSVPATPAPVADPAIGGEVASWCGESNTPGRAICFSFWHRAGLVLDIFMVGPTAELSTERAQTLLLSMVDNAVTGLAGYDTTATDATTVAAAPTTVAGVPVPPSTVPAPTVPAPTAAATTVAATPTTAVAPPPTVAPVPTAAVPSVPVPPTVAGATTPTVPGVPTTLPAGFVRVTDDSGLISVALPTTWTDVQTAGLVLSDGTTTPQLVASTNVATYEASFDVPGISIVTAAPISDPQTIVTNNGLTSGCASITTEPYSDGVFTGLAQVGTSCGLGEGTWKMIVGNTIDGATGVVISLQTASAADQPAIDTALQTLVVS